ncbi:MAG: cytochrome c peroxidase [Gemmatimonadaceae bacterium]
MVELGNMIFDDPDLSLRRNQSCASCHDPKFGFTAPSSIINATGSVMPGSVPTRFGNRRPPSAAYAAFAPVLHFDDEDGAWVGGNFWDGRATGARLGNPSAEQALGPFLNSVEMALPDAACVIYRITHSKYAGLWRATWGNSVGSISFPSARAMEELCGREGTVVPLSPADRRQLMQEYDRVGMSIAAFEASPRVSAFSSKFDQVLRGGARFTQDERAGLALFNGKANCAACHPIDGERALLTDFTFDNLGVPANPENPATIGGGFRDLGLGGFMRDGSLYGAQKVPTLRNLDKRPTPVMVKSFMHNGIFKSLEQVVHFYNTRDVLPRCAAGIRPSDPRFGTTCWPRPEVADNVNTDELGNLGLTPVEERQLVRFLRTFSDR